MENVRVIVWGLGLQGNGAVRMMSEKKWIEIVGAIDVDKEKVGRDVGDVAGIGKRFGVTVSDNPDAVFARTRANMVLHFPACPFDEMEAHIIKSIEARCNVITIAYLRLVYAWTHWPELAQRIDEAAKKNGVTVLPTGLNPGFATDLLPIVFTGACAHVKKISMKRVGDKNYYNAANMANYGIGFTLEEFQKGLADGSVGWKFPQSSSQIDMVADALGWKLDETRLRIEPITSKKKKITSSGMVIEPGLVGGIKFVHSGMKGGEEVVTTEWIGLLDPEGEGLKEGDYISIKGEPNIDVAIKGLGGEVTYATAVNRIPQVIKAGPGLVTVKDLPVVACLK